MLRRSPDRVSITTLISHVVVLLDLVSKIHTIGTGFTLKYKCKKYIKKRNKKYKVQKTIHNDTLKITARKKRKAKNGRRQCGRQNKMTAQKKGSSSTRRQRQTSLLGIFFGRLCTVGCRGTLPIFTPLIRWRRLLIIGI